MATQLAHRSNIYPHNFCDPEDRLSTDYGSAPSREPNDRNYSSSKDALWTGNGDRQARVPDGLRDAARASRGSHDGKRRHGDDDDDDGENPFNNRPVSTPQQPAQAEYPPGKTLSINHLPPNTDEAQLHALLAAQPGYKRLCYRTKPISPLCFVEFETEMLADRAGRELGLRMRPERNPLSIGVLRGEGGIGEERERDGEVSRKKSVM